MILKTEKLVISRANGLTLSFHDIELHRGDGLLLLGPSGSGKTTLLSTIAGFLPPASGSVTVAGQDLYKLPAADRDELRGKKLGFVFQTLHLLPTLSVIDNILLAAKMAGLTPGRQKAQDLLNVLGLGQKTHHKPPMISQGEQQRAAIARAVFNGPDIIVADEPTSALDDRNAAIIMDLLEEQAKKTNAALLVATHDSRIMGRFSKTMSLQDTVKGDA